MDKVRTGQKFIPRAADWNSFIDAANFVRNHEQAENFGSNFNTAPGIVTVKNITGTDFPIFSCLYLSDLSVMPQPDTKSNKYYFQPIVFAATNYPDPAIKSNSKVCILQEPIPAGAIGKAMIFGISHGKVTIGNLDHRFAAPNSSGGMNSTEKKGPVRIIWQDGLNLGEQQCVLMLIGKCSKKVTF